ncbi:Coronin [Scophthalmus maximus]|uniref:Coronin n=1 Tax=Scophthalmus maximus TaxID=52904 RepID=A0A2U9BBD1_SCOMX|nr:Coronin [Scophthalmus maximus]
MSWRPTYRSSKFRNVYGKVANREHCFDGVPITKNVHDNHFCAVNSKFVAVVTESAGGGSFMVIPVAQSGRLDSHYSKVCGHQGNVLDIKWNPFFENIIASCSEDTSCQGLDAFGRNCIGENPEPVDGLGGPEGKQVRVCDWIMALVATLVDVAVTGQWPWKTASDRCEMPLSKAHMHLIDSCRATLAVSCVNVQKNLFFTFYDMLRHCLTTTEDVNVQLDLRVKGAIRVLLPSSSAVHFLNSMGKILKEGDGNIRYFEITTEKPYIQYLMEFRSPAPQKGLGVMPKHGLDVAACEVFRFYKLVTLKGLIEPVSMIVPRRSDTYQEDIYPMTAGTEPALSAGEWLSGINRGEQHF